VIIVRRTLIVFCSAVLVSMLLPGCSTGYLVRAAMEEGDILLKLVRAARNFAPTVGLDPGESFTQFSRVDRDILAWVLVASQRDSFTLHTWWFPVVGTVPYKGFFEKDEAIDAAKELEAQGYEGWVRGTEAFSTLGWFNDPVLSTTLKHAELDIVNTVLHESVHTTVWIPDHVDFNESLANFFAHQVTVQFFDRLARTCEEKKFSGCAPHMVDVALDDLHAEFELSRIVTSLYTSLDELYKSGKSREEKLKTRGEIFERELGPHRESLARLKYFTAINNAQVMQFKLYLTGFDLFKGLYDRKLGDPKAFLQEMTAIRDKIQAAEGAKPNPFDLLKSRITELDADYDQARKPLTERSIS
jgi:predicted aminopeptidase